MTLISKFLDQYYRAMQQRHPAVLWFGDETRREIALTFDDGPHPQDTPQVLEMLAKHNIKATFFLVGKYVEQYPALVMQIHQSGHQFGIHCYRHRPFPLENPVALRAQLDRTRNAIANVCGVSPESIKDLRPPYGAFTPKLTVLLAEWGYRLVLWNNMPLHWIQSTGWTVKQIIEQALPGSIIVLHDGHGHGTKAAQILDIMIPRLKAQGFQFVTIEKMRESITKELQKLSSL
jgi:peptidoglycan/xylan/chitin deacetylase (PgdA/CDA1 family)